MYKIVDGNLFYYDKCLFRWHFVDKTFFFILGIEAVLSDFGASDSIYLLKKYYNDTNSIDLDYLGIYDNLYSYLVSKGTVEESDDFLKFNCFGLKLLIQDLGYSGDSKFVPVLEDNSTNLKFIDHDIIPENLEELFSVFYPSARERSSSTVLENESRIHYSYEGAYLYSLGVLFGCQILGYSSEYIWYINPDIWYKGTYKNLLKSAWKCFSWYIENHEEDRFKNPPQNELWNFPFYNEATPDEPYRKTIKDGLLVRCLGLIDPLESTETSIVEKSYNHLGVYVNNYSDSKVSYDTPVVSLDGGYSFNEISELVNLSSYTYKNCGLAYVSYYDDALKTDYETIQTWYDGDTPILVWRGISASLCPVVGSDTLDDTIPMFSFYKNMGWRSLAWLRNNYTEMPLDSSTLRQSMVNVSTASYAFKGFSQQIPGTDRFRYSVDNIIWYNSYEELIDHSIDLVDYLTSTDLLDTGEFVHPLYLGTTPYVLGVRSSESYYIFDALANKLCVALYEASGEILTFVNGNNEIIRTTLSDLHNDYNNRYGLVTNAYAGVLLDVPGYTIYEDSLEDD